MNRLWAAILICIFFVPFAYAVDTHDPGESLPDFGPDFDFDDVLSGDFDAGVEEIKQEIEKLEEELKDRIGKELWEGILDEIEQHGAPTLSPNSPVMKLAFTHPRLLGDTSGVLKIGYRMPFSCTRILRIANGYDIRKIGERRSGATRWNICTMRLALTPALIDYYVGSE